MAYEIVKVKVPMWQRVLPYLSITLFFSCWQAIVDFGLVPETMLASPTDVLKLFVLKLNEPNPDGAVLSMHVWTSVQEAFTGYLLSLLVGIPIGLLMGWFNLAEGLVRPIFEIIRPIPPIAWIPLTIFWFGIGLGAKSSSSGWRESCPV